MKMPLMVVQGAALAICTTLFQICYEEYKLVLNRLGFGLSKFVFFGFRFGKQAPPPARWWLSVGSFTRLAPFCCWFCLKSLVIRWRVAGLLKPSVGLLTAVGGGRFYSDRVLGKRFC
jgi:hypothetical protein